MASHSFTVSSSLGKDDAYPRLADLANVPEWDSGVTSSVRRTESGSQPWYEVTTAGFDGQPMTSRYEIRSAQAPDYFVMVGENDVFRAVDSVVFCDAEGGGCSVHYHGTLELLGDDPPLSPRQLDSMFPKIAVVAEAGLNDYLNP